MVQRCQVITLHITANQMNTCFVNNASSISIPLYASAQIFHKSRTVDATSTTLHQATSLHLHILAQPLRRI
jgi:hypothetical protein